ncbi:unnamed protein product [Peniophora sp. CBMAI 1063]|nr:unnamed protein product [Peniophora sp. CBMAI 1063]
MPRFATRSLLALVAASVALCAPEPQLDGLSFTSDGNSGLPGGANMLIPVVQNLADADSATSAVPDLNLSADTPYGDGLTDNLPSSAALQDGLAARPNNVISDLEDPYPLDDETQRGPRAHSKRQTRPPPSSQGRPSNRPPTRQGPTPPTAPEDRNHVPLQELQLSEFVTCLSQAGSSVQQRAVDVLKRANEGAAAFHELPCSNALPSQASDVLFGSFTKRTTVSHEDVEAGLAELQGLVATLSAMGTQAQGLASGNTKRASFGDALRHYRGDGESQYSSHHGHYDHNKHHGHGGDGNMGDYGYERRQFQDTELPAALDSDNLKETIRAAASQSATSGTVRPTSKPTNDKLLGIVKRDESSGHERRQAPAAASATSIMPVSSASPNATYNSTNPDPNSIEAIVKGVGSPVTSGLSSGGGFGGDAEKRDAELQSRQVGGLPQDFDPFNGGSPINGDELSASAASGSSTSTPTGSNGLVGGLVDTVQGLVGTVDGVVSIVRKRALGTLKALQQLSGPVASSVANAGHKRDEDLDRRQRGAAPASPNRRPAPANRPDASPAAASPAPSASTSAGVANSLTNLLTTVSKASSGNTKRSIHDNGRHAVIDPVLGTGQMQARDSSANANAAEREAVDAVHNVNSGARLVEGNASDDSQDLRLHLDSLSDVATTLLHPYPTSTSTAGVSIQTLDGSANKPSPRALIDTGKISNQLAGVTAGPGKKAPRALIDTGKISNQLNGLTGKLKRDVGLTFAENERRSPLPPSRMDSRAEDVHTTAAEDAM